MTERVTAESRDRSAEEFFDSLESVALAVEGSALGTSEAPFSAYSKMRQRHQEEATGDQIWSSNTHLCHERAISARNQWTCYYSKVFQAVLQQVRHLKLDVIAGDANTAAYKNHKKL